MPLFNPNILLISWIKNLRDSKTVVLVICLEMTRNNKKNSLRSDYPKTRLVASKYCYPAKFKFCYVFCNLQCV
jgi:hypothetical protein